jgi:hypothetical protein
MLANTLMITLTHPQETAREAEFNEWYTGNHVPDVLQAPGFRDAIRCKLALTVAGDVSPYLALYHVDSDDGVAADEALTEYLATPNPTGLEIPPSADAPDGNLVLLDVGAYFRKRLEVGHNDASPHNAPKAVLITMTGPADGIPVQELNTWYDAHVDDIVTTPGIRGGARYDLVKVRQGTISPYFAFYDLDTNDVEQVVDDLAKNMAVCPSGGIPTSPDGEPWLQVDGFAYFTLVSAHTTEFTLLPSPFASPVASVASELSSTA